MSSELEECRLSLSSGDSLVTVITPLITVVLQVPRHETQVHGRRQAGGSKREEARGE